MSNTPTTPQDPSGADATTSALSALLVPLARLAVSQGVGVQVVEELLRVAFVDAARQALVGAGLPEHRLVSRISTSTGLTRREVARLTQPEPAQARPVGGSLASEVFTRWVTARGLRSPKGEMRPLRRTGPAPSFEALARSVTQDVHPRTLLEELCRLGMAEVDEERDTVVLTRDAFVPGEDKQHMLGFLAGNVGDHLNGAVFNVLSQPDARKHFDQAVFADELSPESLAVVREFVISRWKNLLDDAVALLERRIEEDKAEGRAQDRRVRIGLYSFDEAVGAPKAAAADKPDTAGKAEPAKKKNAARSANRHKAAATNARKRSHDDDAST